MVVRRSWTPLHSIRVLLYSTVPPGVNSTPIPINLGSSTDIVVLELFGTGVRGVNSYIGGGSPFATLGNVVSVGNGWTVLYAGPQGAGASGSFYGMDQIKAVYKDWNLSGDALARQLQTFKEHGVHVLGSFIFGLPTDKPSTFDATVAMAQKAGITFAQFVMMTPFPGTVDFGRWEKEQAENPTMVGDVPITRYWLIPTAVRPKMFTPHPTMSSDEIRERTQKVWDRFYNWGAIWKRSACCPNITSRIAFMFLSKLYRQMYAGTGISTDSARRKKSKAWAKWTARQL